MPLKDMGLAAPTWVMVNDPLSASFLLALSRVLVPLGDMGWLLPLVVYTNAPALALYQDGPWLVGRRYVFHSRREAVYPPPTDPAWLAHVEKRRVASP